MGRSRDQYLNKYHQAVAEADRLWWVNIIDPDGVDLGCHGGGTSLAEAVAVAWINTCISPHGGRDQTSAMMTMPGYPVTWAMAGGPGTACAAKLEHKLAEPSASVGQHRDSHGGSERHGEGCCDACPEKPLC